MWGPWLAEKSPGGRHGVRHGAHGLRQRRQVLHVVADSGSNTLLLDSSFCTQPACAHHQRYEGNRSSSAFNPAGGDSAFMVHYEYGQGTVETIAWRDHVKLGALVCAVQQYRTRKVSKCRVLPGGRPKWGD